MPLCVCVLQWQQLLAKGNDILDDALEQRTRMCAPNRCCSLIYTVRHYVIVDTCRLKGNFQFLHRSHLVAKIEAHEKYSLSCIHIPTYTTFPKSTIFICYWDSIPTLFTSMHCQDTHRILYRLQLRQKKYFSKIHIFLISSVTPCFFAPKMCVQMSIMHSQGLFEISIEEGDYL